MSLLDGLAGKDDPADPAAGSISEKSAITSAPPKPKATAEPDEAPVKKPAAPAADDGDPPKKPKAAANEDEPQPTPKPKPRDPDASALPEPKATGTADDYGGVSGMKESCTGVDTSDCAKAVKANWMPLLALIAIPVIAAVWFFVRRAKNKGQKKGYNAGMSDGERGLIRRSASS